MAVNGWHTIAVNGWYICGCYLTDVIAFACQQIRRDFTEEERVFYRIGDTQPTCPETAVQVAQVEPTWTPFATSPAPVVGPNLVTQVNFIPMEIANVQMDLPVQHVYISAGDEVVARPLTLEADILAQPLYNSSEFVADTLDPPFNLGPFPKGEPLGFTLADWVAAEGHGTYTIRNNRAYLDLTFEKLVPNGVYTLWCVKFQPTPFVVLKEVTCGVPDGSENNVIVDEKGHAVFQLEMDPFPVSTEEIMYELALAYHSDGQTYGAHMGEYGKNLHAQMIFDFLPPGQ